MPPRGDVVDHALIFEEEYMDDMFIVLDGDPESESSDGSVDETQEVRHVRSDAVDLGRPAPPSPSQMHPSFNGCEFPMQDGSAEVHEAGPSSSNQHPDLTDIDDINDMNDIGETADNNSIKGKNPALSSASEHADDVDLDDVFANEQGGSSKGKNKIMEPGNLTGYNTPSESVAGSSSVPGNPSSILPGRFAGYKPTPFELFGFSNIIPGHSVGYAATPSASVAGPSTIPGHSVGYAAAAAAAAGSSASVGGTSIAPDPSVGHPAASSASVESTSTDPGPFVGYAATSTAPVGGPSTTPGPSVGSGTSPAEFVGTPGPMPPCKGLAGLPPHIAEKYLDEDGPYGFSPEWTFAGAQAAAPAEDPDSDDETTIEYYQVNPDDGKLVKGLPPRFKHDPTKKAVTTVPEEILNEVFKHLDSKDDISKLMRTSKAAYRVGLPYLFHHLDLAHNDSGTKQKCDLHSFVKLIKAQPEVVRYLAKTESLSLSNFEKYGCKSWIKSPPVAKDALPILRFQMKRIDPKIGEALAELHRPSMINQITGHVWEHIWMMTLGIFFSKIKTIEIVSVDEGGKIKNPYHVMHHADIFRGFPVPKAMQKNHWDRFDLSHYHVTHLSLSGKAVGSVLRLLFEIESGREFQALVSLELETDFNFNLPVTHKRMNLKHLRLRLRAVQIIPLPRIIRFFQGLESFEMFLKNDEYGWEDISGVLKEQEKTLKFLNFDHYHVDMYPCPTLITGPLIDQEGLEVIAGTAESIMMNPDREITDYSEELFPPSIRVIKLQHYSAMDAMILRFIASQLPQLPNLQYVILDWGQHLPKALELEDIQRIERTGAQVIRNNSWPPGVCKYNEGWVQEVDPLDL